MSFFLSLLAGVGSALVLWVLADTLWSVLLGLKVHLLPYFKAQNADLVKKYGSWAVVTGSTDGIGRAYAKELAKRGVNIVLISRSIEKLLQVSHEIESEFGVKTKVIAVDFSKGQPVFDEIEKELKDIPVGILVNNVGKQYAYPTYLGEVPEQDLWDIVNINVGAATAMTRMLVPQMKERRQGAIVNVSSSSEMQPLPLMTVYAASKVFLKSFSDALRFEYEKDGITVQHLSPLFVNTKMNAFSHRLQETSLFVPDAQTYAYNAVNTLGQINHSTGYWAHGLQYFCVMLSPIWMRTWIGGVMNQGFRSDYFQKAGKHDQQDKIAMT
ncbi:unnamed protein product [Bemisia tabaci]|uniref:Inactive hydroxysteroid dehydrogenase-like protein 1 n=1 Tax=Bemisia tabaci TaxID=7038 RepID=A0A9P0C868_BEMTA|nr:PREDICTED: inactive hydroxysteroid dehydrogenase-like protein 1 [Bemisia tabaci]CAH0754822.1 unnamed protein product [Bemisia tabaci]